YRRGVGREGRAPLLTVRRVAPAGFVGGDVGVTAFVERNRLGFGYRPGRPLSVALLDRVEPHQQLLAVLLGRDAGRCNRHGIERPEAKLAVLACPTLPVTQYPIALENRAFVVARPALRHAQRKARHRRRYIPVLVVFTRRSDSLLMVVRAMSVPSRLRLLRSGGRRLRLILEL